ncbi:helix-turn-helix domain-containing protein [Streptomyces sp. NPDC048717]|uniref:helix-turn-helix domain-containing protein n=1 Tax=Streptomyces sp. NPDC048717 TaxID=3154928 RepID=UPI0034452D09
MASKHISVPVRASGLNHVNVRHTSRFTVVGNHLAQHDTLSLLAIGLAVYLQSLPAGAPVSIKAVASRFPESELRVGRAMRELEHHGYFRRTRERLANGNFAHHPTSYNFPEAEPEPVRETAREAVPKAVPETPVPRPKPQAAPTPEPVAKPAPTPEPVAKPAPEPEAAPTHAPERSPEPVAPAPLPARHRPAADLLANLRLHDPRLLLSTRDIERLAPGLTTWLDNGARPDAALRTLSACLPHDLHSPAALLAHRLTALLPPPLPLPAAPASPARVLDDWVDCDGCDRVFRAPEPGLCRDCRLTAASAASVSAA